MRGVLVVIQVEVEVLGKTTHQHTPKEAMVNARLPTPQQQGETPLLLRMMYFCFKGFYYAQIVKT
jgi:hypothetical protein